MSGQQAGIKRELMWLYPSVEFLALYEMMPDMLLFPLSVMILSPNKGKLGLAFTTLPAEVPGIEP